MNWLREANAEPITGYRLIEPLGSGGFGEVWKCEAPGGLLKAIKFVYGNLNSMDVDGVRADQEYKALQRIKEVRHPFVCMVERIDFIEGELIIVMELADQTLHDRCKTCQDSGLIGIPGEDMMRYLRDAAEALDYMHSKHNLQHLDVKPRNLFLIGDRVKVADFGLVKCLEKSQSSGIMGGVTPLYAPPETYQGKISPRSDQYSLAIVYQELLTGHRPFQAKNIRQMAQMHMSADPDLRSLPEVERSVIARALSKEPESRYASCMAFVAALYKARSSTRLVEVRSQALAGGAGQKSTTMSETMEDLFLPECEVSQRGVPGLLKQHAKASTSGGNEDPDVEVSDLGVTIVQPEKGALRPTLIIGVGTFGRKAIMELRCRFLDRFGDLGKLPLLRFLYLDTDPEAAGAAHQGAPEVALGRNDYYALPLQPVVNYRRRILDQLAEWLPRDKLYGMPRSLQTQGSRALGRLAYADNQQRLLAKLRRDIGDITHPDTLYKSVEKTGLALNNNIPRVYVIAAAGGGSSGMLADLGYALRRLLNHLRQPDAKVTALLMTGATEDPATPKFELANVHATLTELNHFSDEGIPFAAQYGSDGQRIVDPGSPFHSIYLLPLAHRSPDALAETVAHLGSYLFHELTTPLGVRLDHLRLKDDAGVPGSHSGSMNVSLRNFGTYAVWFPRGLLLNRAARHACKRLIDIWIAADTMQSESHVQTAIQKVVQRFVNLPELSADALAKQIEAGSHVTITGEVTATPDEVLSSLLAKLDDQLMQSVAQDDPVNWCKQAMSRIRDWMGIGGDDPEYNEWRKTKLARSVAGAAQKLAEKWAHDISKEACDLLALPGARVAGAEAALDLLHKHFNKLAELHMQAYQLHTEKSGVAWKEVETAALECGKSSGFRFFGGRSKTRQLRAFLERLSDYAHARLSEELIGAGRQCFVQLVGKLADRARDLGFCRQRLRNLQENLDRRTSDDDDELAATRNGASDITAGSSGLPSAETFWNMIRASATARVVLPDGRADLEESVLSFLQQLTGDQWRQLDTELHEKVLQPQGGLNGACMNGDLTRQMAIPLLEGATQFLNQHLPIMDVAQIIKTEAEAGESLFSEEVAKSLKEQTQDYLAHAAPAWRHKQGHGEHSFLLVPASTAGKALGAAIQAVCPELKLVSVPGQADLMFMREQGGLSADELVTLLKPCRAAYEQAALVPATSPHARFDITDWLPLEP